MMRSGQFACLSAAQVFSGFSTAMFANGPEFADIKHVNKMCIITISSANTLFFYNILCSFC